jgi:MFS family permease
VGDLGSAKRYRAPIMVGLTVIAGSTVILGQGWTGAALGPLTVAPFVILAIVVGMTGVGTGLVMPASNNAALDLLPGRAGVISGLRGMCRSTGGIIGTAVIMVVLEMRQDKAASLRTIFTAYGVLLLTTIPLTLLVPDLSRESRRRADRSGGPARRAPPAANEPGAAPASAPPAVGAAGSADR